MRARADFNYFFRESYIHRVPHMMLAVFKCVYIGSRIKRSLSTVAQTWISLVSKINCGVSINVLKPCETSVTFCRCFSHVILSLNWCWMQCILESKNDVHSSDLATRLKVMFCLGLLNRNSGTLNTRACRFELAACQGHLNLGIFNNNEA